MQYEVFPRPTFAELLKHDLFRLNYYLFYWSRIDLECDEVLFQPLLQSLLAAGWKPTVKDYHIHLDFDDQEFMLRNSHCQLLASNVPTDRCYTPDEVTQIASIHNSGSKSDDSNDSDDSDSEEESRLAAICRLNRNIVAQCDNETNVHVYCGDEWQLMEPLLHQGGYTNIQSSDSSNTISFTCQKPQFEETWTSHQMQTKLIPNQVRVTNGRILCLLAALENIMDKRDVGKRFVSLPANALSCSEYEELQWILKSAGYALLVDAHSGWVIDMLGTAEPGDKRNCGQKTSTLYA